MNKKNKIKKHSLNTVFFIILIVIALLPLIQALFIYLSDFNKTKELYKPEDKRIYSSYGKNNNIFYRIRKSKAKKYIYSIAEMYQKLLSEESVSSELYQLYRPDFIGSYQSEDEAFLDWLKGRIDLFYENTKTKINLRIRVLDKNLLPISDSTSPRDIDRTFDRNMKTIALTNPSQEYFAEADKELAKPVIYGYDYYDSFYYYKKEYSGQEILDARDKGKGFVERSSVTQTDLSVLYSAVPFYIDNSVYGYILVSHSFEYAPTNILEWIGEYALFSYPGILFAFIIALYLYFYVTKPIVKLSEKASKIKIMNGTFVDALVCDKKRKDEIGILYSSYNELVGRLNQRLEELSLYSYRVPHSLKNCLASINNSIYLLEHEENIKNKEKLDELIKSMSISVKKADSYLSELKEYSRAGLEKSCEKEDVCLNEFAQNILNRVKASYKNVACKYFGVQKDFDNQTINPDCFEPVVENLLENAFSFASTVYLTLNVKIENNLKILQIIIEDNGPGVPQEEIPRIFKFGYSNRQEKYKNDKNGSGIGLALVEKLVKYQLDGSIQVYKSSELGGAKFIISYPI